MPFTLAFLCLLGGRPRLRTPLNGILWFNDLYLYHQLFTPFDSVVSDIHDFFADAIMSNKLRVHFLLELAAVVNQLG